MANAAVSYIKSKGGKDETFRLHLPTSTADEVISDLMKIVASNKANIVLRCMDSCPNPGVGFFGSDLAYTNGLDIYFCENFYKQKPLTSLCMNPIVGIRGSTVFYFLAEALIPNSNKKKLGYRVST